MPATAKPEPAAAIRTRVLSLSLAHFRNYHSARIETDERSVVLVGPNGAGKTNLLEAISLLTPGRGLRRATLADMDNSADHAPWAVSAEIQGPQGSARIGTGRDPEEGAPEKRIVRLDGKTLRGQNELARVFAAIWLTPQMDTLFLEGGTVRRKFIDRLVYSFDPEHAGRVYAYEYAMRERNRLLQDGRADPAWLSALEQKMAEHGVAITVARLHLAEGLNDAIRLARHSFPQAGITLTGTIESALLGGAALKAEEALREDLAQSRAADRAAGRALVGAHRSQVEVTHAEKAMQAERCSTGEQKALLLSIVLAQAKAGAAWHGRVPVLLLDEVVSHLDAQRREELFTELAATGAQVWLTGTDRELFEPFAAHRIEIKDGVVT